jgi:hypothetical protein
VEPIREQRATVNDLLDRLLEKGVVLDLDMVIGVAGIPLIGVSLRAAIAAIETMIDYGLLESWDESTRRYAERDLQRKKLAYAPGEGPLLEMFGAHWYADGIYRAWRPGRLFLTDRRLILYRRMPAEVLFEIPLGLISGLLVAESIHFNGHSAPLLHLALDSGEEASLYVEDVAGLETALRERLATLGVALAEPAGLGRRDREITAAFPESRILAEGKMWRQAPDAAGVAAAWQPGSLYLTDEALLWWSENSRRIAARIPVEDIAGVGLEVRELDPVLKARAVLGVRHRRNGRPETVLFAGESLEEWRRAIRRTAVNHEGGKLP